jgi:phosphoglucosamine mutase
VKLFGTDGVRGRFGEPPLDRATVETLAFELGRWLHAALGRQPVLLLGGDTRASREELSSWIEAGLDAAGADFRDAGMLPTPGIAWLVRHLGVDGGIVLSASHNPWHDNGIKWIDAEGFKASTCDEARLEERVQVSEFRSSEIGTRDYSGRFDHELVEPYLDALSRGVLASSSTTQPLDGLSVVLDTANGAASPYAGRLFEALGARTTVLFDQPDGHNINFECGSTAPQIVAAQVEKLGADIGVAFDGDADRAILCDDRGRVRDGDEILFLWASALKRQQALCPPRVVATRMSNLGLARALGAIGVTVEDCDVGDRAVVETLRREGLCLGGEQSGHTVNLALSTSGDGMQTALHLAALVAEAKRQDEGMTLSRLLEPFERFPQILINVEVARKPSFDTIPEIQSQIEHIETALGSEGRLLLRYSGTEPKARVMIEGPDEVEIRRYAETLALALQKALGS